MIHGVCILGAGLILPVNASGDAAPDDIRNFNVGHSADRAFGIFLLLLWTCLAFQPAVAPNLLSHVRIGNLLDEEYRRPPEEA
jgi:hypothetical protein